MLVCLVRSSRTVARCEPAQGFHFGVFHFFPFSYVFDASTRTNISIRVGLEELIFPYVSDCHIDFVDMCGRTASRCDELFSPWLPCRLKSVILLSVLA